MDAAQGDAVVLIDADLQDPPEVIPEMAARWREGYHVAYGPHRRREGETAFKLFTANLFLSDFSIAFRPSRCQSIRAISA